MKINTLKKTISCIFAAAIITASLTACQSGSTPEDGANSTTAAAVLTEPDLSDVVDEPTAEETTIDDFYDIEFETYKEPTFYYSAVKGAVIVEQDGSPQYVYCLKCDHCGYVQDNIRNTRYGGGLLTAFTCNQCGEHQEVVIEQSEH